MAAIEGNESWFEAVDLSRAITNEDVSRIVTTFVTNQGVNLVGQEQREQPMEQDGGEAEAVMNAVAVQEQGAASFQPEWHFIFLVAIDLGVNVETLQGLKEQLRRGEVSDSAALTRLLTEWIGRDGAAATWRRLISCFSSNVMQYPGVARRDYVGLLKSLLPSWQRFANIVMERAWRMNSIQNEIYGRLSITDGQSLRNASRFCNQVTLQNYRKTAILSIVPFGSSVGLTLESFFGLFTRTPTGEWVAPTTQLMEHPYEQFVIHGERITPFREDWRESDRFFWEVYAKNVVHLTLESCAFFHGCFMETFNWLLLKACPKLQSLKIINCRDSVDICPAWQRQDFPGAIAKNLRSLEIQGTMVSELEKRELLKICPGIEVIPLDQIGLLEGLLTPVAPFSPEEVVKLHTISLELEQFNLFNRFIERYPEKIKNVKVFLRGTRTFRTAPFEFYSTLAKCSRDLTSLEVVVKRRRDTNPRGIPKWFFELSTMNFDQLRSLKVEGVKFDFGSLKAMPNLKTLFVRSNCGERKNDTGDFIYEGQRNKYCPRGRVSQEFVTDQPIFLEGLEKFEFQGWKLNIGDLEHISRWFPRLKHLTAAVNVRARAGFGYISQDFFYNLETITFAKLARDPPGDIEEIVRRNRNKRLRIFLKDVPGLGTVEGRIGEGQRVVFQSCN